MTTITINDFTQAIANYRMGSWIGSMGNSQYLYYLTWDSIREMENDLLDLGVTVIWHTMSDGVTREMQVLLADGAVGVSAVYDMRIINRRRKS